MNAYTFLCSKNTEQECMDRFLLGAPSDAIYRDYLRYVEAGDYLFLWNYDTGCFRGPFTALTKCAANIEPDAFRNVPSHRNGFPMQVRVNGDGQYKSPLTADDLSQAGLLHPTKLGLMPPASLSNQQSRTIIELFRKKNGDNSPYIETNGWPVIRGDERSTGSAYIFKCDRVTGGRCFSENVMGAPMQMFRDLVSNVLPGATIFLWQIEEHRLYGVWSAATRGQYDPTAFPEVPEKQFHAVVHCNKDMKLESGIEEHVLRSIVPYDGAFPPYRIDPRQASKLIDALLAANKAEVVFYKTNKGDDYIAEDGHCVRSQAELIIDNMLYGHRLAHAYEKRVQVGAKYMKCDFYIPSGDIYVEYWGLLDKPEYAARREEKLEMYRKARITPLELFPKDLESLSEVWTAKLARYSA